jgi:hypothetical protein
LATHDATKQQVTNYLTHTRQGVLDAVEGLSDADLQTAVGRTIGAALAGLLAEDEVAVALVSGAVPPATAERVAAWQDRPVGEVLAALGQTRAALLAALAALPDGQLTGPVALPDRTTSLIERLEANGEHNAAQAAELTALRAHLDGLVPAPADLPSKADLITYLQATRQQVLDALAGLSRAQLETPGATAEGWAPRDLLATLAAWDREVAGAIVQIMQGEHPLIPDMTPEDIARFDARAVERGRAGSLETRRGDLHAARSTLLAALEPITEAQLYQPPAAVGDTISTVGSFLNVRAAQDSARAGELALWRATLG